MTTRERNIVINYPLTVNILRGSTLTISIILDPFLSFSRDLKKRTNPECSFLKTQTELIFANCIC